jgi:hypothetical protein
VTSNRSNDSSSHHSDLATAAIICSPTQLNTHTKNNTTAIADTGASDHYFTPTAPVINIKTGSKPAILRTATGELKQSTASAHLAIQGIPTEVARTVHIIPGFTNNLLSLGKLCDADCTAKLDKHNLTIYNKDGHQILQGEREQQGARLWHVNIAPTPANIIEPDEASINETATPAPTLNGYQLHE